MKEGLQRFTKKGIELRERFSKGMIIRSLVVFLLSLVLFNTTSNYYIELLSGLGLIIAGAIVGLFILVFLIFYFLERKMEPVPEAKPKKKITKKKVTTKKKVVKKATKKKVAKKTSKKK